MGEGVGGGRDADRHATISTAVLPCRMPGRVGQVGGAHMGHKHIEINMQKKSNEESGTK